MSLSIVISVPLQTLTLLDSGKTVETFSVSTARAGVGERNGSGQTPRGEHIIRAKIGAQAPLNAVFRGRRWTGEIYSQALADVHPERDWILTRILWLSGTQKGFNRGGDVDTMRRYIYLHGTPDSEPMGEPLSHGCIRMRNQDIIRLFDRVGPGTPVLING
ncbi:L,D-transpeptidase [Hahella sp. KA22]|uniref:L,D-transpeptidase n=1 Tax=Hahella sp. KA22 TaxID=1628392 RepID=UPI000FDE295C|nr:L,D-transpeptidase [Hahella sp. KA22]AZZ93038.1 L,D-transpeptidase [Hahella sp. KA22]QAY56412.1 L,D-transpeptidase [Hahella sp. KA22]